MLPEWQQWWFELSHFFDLGGWVLYVILLVSFVLATLLLERMLFRFFFYRKLKNSLLEHLQGQTDWRVRRGMICDLELALKLPFAMIKNLIALCPLIGLLGTVTGMIQVFDSLAMQGNSNSRLIASGVARSTFPTMTGMAVAVTGLLFYSQLHQWADKESLRLNSLKGHK